MTSQPQTTTVTDHSSAEEFSEYLTGLNPTVRNLISAAVALARIDELGWAPRSGYPGSDEQWQVHCLVCGWSGERFYSHLRRDRPRKRHDGCAPPSKRPQVLAALAAYAKDSCNCRADHPTTPDQTAHVIEAIVDAYRQEDSARLLAGLGRLLAPCPATAARAAAVAEYTSARN
ncbi:hypothetical protein ABCR94_00530 [Streptomyces sp. 21So2-11]|uniref:hypothetical protein n=1 Tax=Streptomyces sp. 21So2-11 TaxID=3144408 RepID=UPI00321A5AD1